MKTVSRAILFAFGLVLVACKSQPSSDASPSGSASQKLDAHGQAVDGNGRAMKLIDEAELRAVCLLAKMPTPPEVTTNRAYDVGVLATSKLHERYAWVIVDAAFRGEKRTELAETYVRDVEVAFMNTPIEASHCRSGWETSLAESVITIVLRTSGTESSGDYLVMGGTPKKLAHKSLSKVSLGDARKTALALGFDAFGRKLRSVKADSDWAALAQTAD